MTVNILLATYNGKNYIVEQLDSIIQQCNLDITLVIRDDNSVDGTYQLVTEVGNKFQFVIVHKNNTTESGHKNNFAALCDSALLDTGDYFCFSDQDDVWLPEKVSVLHTRMIELETLHGKDTPILIHSDLSVVDEQLNEIASSFIEYQGLPNPSDHSFPEFLYQNVVTGCACMFNRALLDIAAPIPSQAVVHDWWFALCAKQFGVLDYIDKPLVLYRQHGANAIGATATKSQTSLLKKHFYSALLKYPENLSLAVEQAKCLLDLTQKHKNSKQKNIKYISEFANIKQRNAFERLRYAHHFMNSKRKILQRIYLYVTFFIIKWL